jgi:SdiA-regulated protein
MPDDSDDKDEDDKKSRDYLERDDAIAPRPLAPATLTIPIAPPKPDKKLGKDKDAVRFVGKLGKKQKRLRKDAVRNLDSWERYRALTDALDEAVDLVDLADHKARFALVIMAAVNVVLFFTADALDPLKSSSTAMQVVVGTYMFVYVLIALYFFLQAIESLRPRRSQPQVNPVGGADLDEFPLGIRFYEDILRRDVDAYKKAWQEVRIGQLNAELAVQAHALAEINSAKFTALRKLYKGLQIMTLMAVGLVALGGIAGLVGTAKKAANNGLTRGADELGKAERFAKLGVKEPSGVAYHPGLGHLFVVGDDGVLAEIDATGKMIRTHGVEQQLEDVAYHPPSGGLLLVSELRSELILFDPAAGRERKRWKLDTPALLGRAPTEANQGFEGLAFRPDPAQPGGGLVYLSHQRAPAVIVAVAFDPNGSAAIDAAAVVSRWEVPGYEDLTALTYVPSIDRVVVIADSRERLLVLGPDGNVQDEVPIPGEQQEGLAFDGSGALWIADDKDKSVLKVPGALAALEARVGATAGPLSRTPKEILDQKKSEILN